MSCHTLLVTAQTGCPFQQITICQLCTEEGGAVNSSNGKCKCNSSKWW